MKKLLSATILLLFTLASYNAYSQKKNTEDKREVRVEVIEREQERDRIERERHLIEEAYSNAVSSYSSYGDGVYVTSKSGSSSSQLSLSKSFDGESKKNEGSFDVDKSVRNINLSLSGKVKTGSIKIKINLSNGDLIKELSIDESADIQFSQSIKIADEVEKYYGKWSYSVEAIKAEGRYQLMISTR